MSIIITGFTSEIGKSLVKGYIKKKKTVFCLGRKNEVFLDSEDLNVKSFSFLIQFKSFELISDYR